MAAGNAARGHGDFGHGKKVSPTAFARRLKQAAAQHNCESALTIVRRAGAIRFLSGKKGLPGGSAIAGRRSPFSKGHERFCVFVEGCTDAIELFGCFCCCAHIKVGGISGQSRGERLLAAVPCRPWDTNRFSRRFGGSRPVASSIGGPRRQTLPFSIQPPGLSCGPPPDIIENHACRCEGTRPNKDHPTPQPSPSPGSARDIGGIVKGWGLPTAGRRRGTSGGGRAGGFSR